MSLNKILLIGNVGQDPQIRTAGENKVASLTLATTEKRKDKTGNVISETEWHNIVIWGKLADVVEKYVSKGSQLYVEGKIKTEKYTDKEGTDRYSTKVYASSLQLLGGRPEGQASQPRPETQSTSSVPHPTTEDDVPDDDLPF